MKCYLALGSNSGNREEHLKKAISILVAKVDVLHISPVYETKPVGLTEQRDFLNMVCEIETEVIPVELLEFTQGVEKAMGREKTVINGPRIIDIDILEYDALHIETELLSIPHARYHDRAFVLAPFADITPDYVHTLLHKTVSELLHETDQEGVKRTDILL